MGRQRTLVIKSLPPGKDRADLLDFVRTHHGEGFRKICFERDGRIQLVFCEPEHATKALERIRQHTVIRVEYGRDDTTAMKAPQLPTSPDPNPVIRVLRSSTPLTRSELEKIMRCYRGFESFEVMEDDESANGDSPERTDRAGRRMLKLGSRPEMAYYGVFRDVFCAERAVEDLNECTNIGVGFAARPERVRDVAERKAKAAGPPSRIDPETVSWIHVSHIPDDVSFASLQRHFARLEGFRFLSFQQDAFLVAYDTDEKAAKAVENLLRNTKLKVVPAERKDVDSLRMPPIKRSTMPLSSLYVRLHPWMSAKRIGQLFALFQGVEDVKPEDDYLVAIFGSAQDASHALHRLESTTDLEVAHVKPAKRGGGGFQRTLVDEDDVQRSGVGGMAGQPRARSVSVSSAQSSGNPHHHERPLSRPPSSLAHHNERPPSRPPSSLAHHNERPPSRPPSSLSHQSERPASRMSQNEEGSLVSDVGGGARSVGKGKVAGFKSPRASPPGSPPVFECRTIFVGSFADKDRADVRELCVKLPGFVRVQFGQSNFRVILQDPDYARDAMATIRDYYPAWRAHYARKEPEEKIIESVGEPSKVIWASTLYWTEPELLKYLSTYPGFERLDFDTAHSWVHFCDVDAATAALTDMNRTTNLYSLFSSKYPGASTSRASTPPNRPATPNSRAQSSLSTNAPVFEPIGLTAALSAISPAAPVAAARQAPKHAWEMPSEPVVTRGSPARKGVVKVNQPNGALANGLMHDAKQPKEIQSNVILVRNSSVSNIDELQSIFATYPGFDGAAPAEAAGRWYCRFKDLESAKAVYASYELRETLGKGFGGVSFQYKGRNEVPENWKDAVVQVENEAEPETQPIPNPALSDPDSDVDEDYMATADPWSRPPSQREQSPTDSAVFAASSTGWSTAGNGDAASWALSTESVAEDDAGLMSAGSAESWDASRPWSESIDDGLDGVPILGAEDTQKPRESSVRKRISLAEVAATAPVFVPSASYEPPANATSDITHADTVDWGCTVAAPHVTPVPKPSLRVDPDFQPANPYEEEEPVHTPRTPAHTSKALHPRESALLTENASLRRNLSDTSIRVSRAESEVDRIVGRITAVGGIQPVVVDDPWGSGSTSSGDGEAGRATLETKLAALDSLVTGLLNEVVGFRRRERERGAEVEKEEEREEREGEVLKFAVEDEGGDSVPDPESAAVVVVEATEESGPCKQVAALPTGLNGVHASAPRDVDEAEEREERQGEILALAVDKDDQYTGVADGVALKSITTTTETRDVDEVEEMEEREGEVLAFAVEDGDDVVA
ncbi:hypothetical protein HK104_001976 [Borealophlyctis nickersoniae]|nr:hypothetical protein HK104_001976 [Borealophlyctis nickersoniae]